MSSFYHSSISHGHFSSCIPESIARTLPSIFCSKENLSELTVKVNDDDGNLIYIPDCLDLVPLELLEFLSKSVLPLIVTSPLDYSISSSELHIRPRNCLPIPPHQDNFYHCFNEISSFKLLIPLTSYKPTNGGLIHVDCPHDVELYDHVASFQKAFSSKIDPLSLSLISQKSFTSHTLSLGDLSWHSLNNIHFAPSNTNDQDTYFLVFRYDHKESTVCDEMLERYKLIYLQSQSSYSNPK